MKTPLEPAHIDDMRAELARETPVPGPPQAPIRRPPEAMRVLPTRQVPRRQDILLEKCDYSVFTDDKGGLAVFNVRQDAEEYVAFLFARDKQADYEWAQKYLATVLAGEQGVTWRYETEHETVAREAGHGPTGGMQI